jgi:hypothetical protein
MSAITSISLTARAVDQRRNDLAADGLERRHPVRLCSGGSMPLGTVRRFDTTLLKVSGSFRARSTSPCRKSDHCMVTLNATGQRSRIAS